MRITITVKIIYTFNGIITFSHTMSATYLRKVLQR